MYSEKIISKMLMEPNCILLGKTSINDSFTVRVCDKNNINGNEVLFDQLKISGLKYLIYNEIKKYINNDYNDLNLWKADIAFGKNLKDLTEEQICKNSEQLVPIIHFKKYFPNQDAVDKSLIFVQVPVTVKDAIDIVLKNDIVIPAKDIGSDHMIMPFMERDFNIAIERIKNNIKNNHNKSKSKPDFDFLFSGGAPGIGKTRYGDELLKYLKNDQSWVPSWWKDNLHIESLYIDFGNGCQLDLYDDHLNPTIIIGLRIAYVFFIENKYDMKFETFRRLVWEYREIFNISGVFDFIADYLNINHEQQLFVFLHIDEFQLIDRWESVAVNERNKNLFKEMINGLAPFMLGPPSRVFVQTFLSGTAPQVVISVKESSKVSFRFINCPQLSFRAMLNIANHYAQEFDAETFDCGTYKWLLCQPFLQLLDDTGGLPRALQYVFSECFKINGGGKEFFNNINNQHFNTIFNNVKVYLEERYKIYKAIENNEKLYLELLYHSIDAIPVYRKTCLDPNDQSCTIENLERDSHIILNSCNDDSSKFIIKMPFFFIALYNDRLKIVSRQLEEVFRIQNKMLWESWEIFVANYDAFRTNLLIKCGKKSARLSELYCGAYGTQSTLDIEVELKELSICSAKEQFSCNKLTDKKSLESIDWVKGENVIVNGGSAVWGDAFVAREIAQNSNYKYILSIHQCKYYRCSTYFTASELNGEYIKNLEGSIDTTGKLCETLSKCQHITIIFTIQPFDDKILTNNCLIITKNNFKRYFGPIFASRATFSMTRDINPNFSDCSWMENGVGKVTAGKIVKARPYLSEDDFYNKFSQAKRSIEKYEKKNTEKKVKLDFYPFNV
ncbi:hypothetical protein RclHR1_01440023 [Rhizophagus clarus]|uniref:Crinkler effector protein N-terminal domain-containing protein n=1 Tax=Rhizophagus clarus TaxID=94130 RepID=A0A2Z6R583_9GLOM|nr:hypothetical protein RclHR1_01440023 [Rhizophagus clarus]